VATLVGCSRSPQDVLRETARSMGVADLKTLQYSGSGYNFAVGQSFNPNSPWPRFNVKSYRRMIDYAAGASQEELVRTQAENPPRGGGQQPIVGEQRQVLVVSGNYAWNVAGETATAAPAAVEERQLQLWLTPHGWLKAALQNNPKVESRTVNGRTVTVVSFTAQGKWNLSGVINEQDVVEKIETRMANPVLGDMPVEVEYSEYKDFGGVKFPTRIVQRQGGYPTLELTVTSVQPNAAVALPVPDAVRQAAIPPIRVEPQKVAAGVWYLAGSSHNSVLVEFQDFVMVIEAPLNEERSEAVIAEVKKLVAGKPIRYLVNTHHHFDHSGGLRTYVAEGATIVTQAMNKPFYEQTFQAPRTLSPDRLLRTPLEAKFEAFTDKYELTNGSQTIQLHLIQGNTHNEGILLAYLPRERLLIEADVFTPPAPGAPPPAAPSPFTVNLYENLQRLGLRIDRILPIHGRVVPFAELLKALGRSA